MIRKAKSVCSIVAFVFAALVMGACSSGGGSADLPSPPDPVLGADELQAVLAAEGVAGLPVVPEVSDELFALGQALFFDKVLSGNHDVSCATCHWPEHAAGDGRTLPRGVGGVGIGASRSFGAIIPRNSQSVLNAHLSESLFHDGRIERDGGGMQTPAGASLTVEMLAVFDPRWELLAAQALFPVLSRTEMRGQVGENEIAAFGDADFDGIWGALRDRVVNYPAYQDLFFSAYPGLAGIGSIEFAHAVNAIAAFEVRAFALADGAFQRFVAGDEQALTALEVRGALEFYGPAGCVRCHEGASFTDGQFHNIALPQFGPGMGGGASGLEDFGRESVTGREADRYRFRTPSLLNVSLTAPYGHLGQYADLRSMVLHYTNADLGLQNYSILANVTDIDLVGTLLANRVDISSRRSNRVENSRNFDVDAVVAFLGALTADSALDLDSLIPSSVPSGFGTR